MTKAQAYVMSVIKKGGVVAEYDGYCLIRGSDNDCQIDINVLRGAIEVLSSRNLIRRVATSPRDGIYVLENQEY